MKFSTKKVSRENTLICITNHTNKIFNNCFNQIKVELFFYVVDEFKMKKQAMKVFFCIVIVVKHTSAKMNSNNEITPKQLQGLFFNGKRFSTNKKKPLKSL